MDKEEVRKILEKVKHPEVDASLLELGMIKDIKVEGNKVEVTMAFPFPGVPIKDMLMNSVKEPLKKLDAQVEIKETIMSPEELQKFLSLEQEKWKGL